MSNINFNNLVGNLTRFSFNNKNILSIFENIPILTGFKDKIVRKGEKEKKEKKRKKIKK